MTNQSPVDPNVQARLDRAKASYTVEGELNKLYHTTITEFAKASIDRARDGAKFVQTAAAAIFAVYTGLLALVFSVTDNPLPLRGALAGVFLGLAVALATAYLAFLTDPSGPPLPDLDRRSEFQLQHSRTARLTAWIDKNVANRRYALRAAVISLLFGVLFIAAPFVSTATPTEDPESVSAPTPPAEVAAGFTEDSLDLFQAQVRDYKRGAAARKAALDAKKSAAETRRADERLLDRRATGLAAAGLLLVFFGPGIYQIGFNGVRRLKPAARAGS